MYATNIISFLLVAAACVMAVPVPAVSESNSFEVLQVRASTSVDPNAVSGTTCTDTTSNVVFHDANVAQLAICGGIAGKITKCGGAPTSTSGASGTALFNLNAIDAGATINVSKGRWEGCVRAARAVCPTGTFTSTCVGGASTGNVAFELLAQ